MDVQATTTGALSADADTVVVGTFEGERVAHDLADGTLQALLDRGEARPKFKHLAVTHADNQRVILVGLGEREAFDGERARIAAAVAHARARELGADQLCWEVPHHVSDEIVAGLVEGTLLHAYRFDRYKPKPDDRRDVSGLLVSAHHDVSEAVNAAAIITAAQNRARDLANAPPNDLTPAALAEYAQRLQGIEVTTLDEEQIRSAGMGAFASVAQGSKQEARLIRLDYRGADDTKPPLGLIGKAVTFDSGGLSLKGRDTMHEMKFDMAGGAAVIEAIAAIAQLRIPINVQGVVGATENMPSGAATRPGDIVRALDGTTIEINNTDAEGRLVLADCIGYARAQGCDRLLDLATLTGAVMVALGSTYAGLMANNEGWAESIEAAGAKTGELLWRLPLHSDYADMIKGRYAQLTNLTERRGASASTAAEFLHHFAGRTPWAHLDIYGMAFDVPKPYLVGKGATGFGVRLVVDVVRGLAE